MDGTKAYLRHFDNLLFLSFVGENGTFKERQDVAREIQVCHRKLSYWEKHPNFIGVDARRGVEKLLKNWQVGEKSPLRLMMKAA